MNLRRRSLPLTATDLPAQEVSSSCSPRPLSLSDAHRSLTAYSGGTCSYPQGRSSAGSETARRTGGLEAEIMKASGPGMQGDENNADKRKQRIESLLAAQCPSSSPAMRSHARHCTRVDRPLVIRMESRACREPSGNRFSFGCLFCTARGVRRTSVEASRVRTHACGSAYGR